jgi:uncharacterized protein involved in outer membrane biogenesis
VRLALDGPSVDLQGLYGTLKPTRMKATLGVTGDFDGQEMRLDLAQSNLAIALSGAVTPTAIVVRDANVRTGAGSLRASGRVGLAGDHAYELKALLRDFDPSRFGLSRAAALNGSISAQGEVHPQLRVRADIALAPSTLFGLPARGRLGWRSIGTSHPRIAIDGHATVGETALGVKGRLVNPADLRSLDLSLDLRGRDLAQLYTLFRLPLPATAPYHVSGQLRYADALWTLQDFSGTVGHSDLAGTFTVDRRSPHTVVKADLTSEHLDIVDLAGFVGGGPHADKVAGKVLPQGEYHLDRLRSADADVTFTGRSFRNPALPLHRMHTHLVLRNGVLKLDPLEFGAAGGTLDGSIVLDASRDVIDTRADLLARGVNLNRIAPGVKALVQSSGKVDARVRLAMRGNSVAAMLGSANGNIAAVMNGGSISDLTLRLANLDLANSLVAMAKGNPDIPVRCLVADFRAQDGVLTPDPLLLDTEHTLVAGTGSVSLADERLDLHLVAQPKDGSMLALRGPIDVQGPFSRPAAKPELGSAIARTGAAVLLGLVATPAAAILPFLEMGKPEKVDCAARIRQARSFIATR